MSAMAAGILSLPRTTIGKKVIMAVTGLIWIGYVVGHLYGNTKIFLGAEYFNTYAEGLRGFGSPFLGHGHFLFVFRVILIASLAAHVWAAAALTVRANEARPVRYTLRETVQASVASRYMRWGGIMILIFIIYHLAHLTWGIPGMMETFVRGDPYANVVTGFQSSFAIFMYLLGLTALGFHLYHGTWSMFHTLGLNNRTYTGMLRVLAWLLAVFIPLGFASIPLAVMFGIVTL